jgi:hypothetical protein
MRVVLLILLVGAAGMAGCTVAREIVELDPPSQPHLSDLERHLDYVDPDDGRPDYIVNRGN